MIAGRRQQCSDPRDRIWAIRGLSPKLAQIVSKTNSSYTLSELRKQVFRAGLTPMRLRASLFLNLPTCTPFAKLEEEGTFVQIMWVIWALLVVVNLITIYRKCFWESREMRGQMMLIWDLCKTNELDSVQSWDEIYQYFELIIWDFRRCRV